MLIIFLFQQVSVIALDKSIPFHEISNFYNQRMRVSNYILLKSYFHHSDNIFLLFVQMDPYKSLRHWTIPQFGCLCPSFFLCLTSQPFFRLK